MKRIRNLGIGALMALVLTAFVGASSASASFYLSGEGKFVVDGSTKSIHGEGPIGIELGLPSLELTVLCNSLDVNNPEPFPSSKTLLLFADIAGCKIPGSGLTATVDAADCVLMYRTAAFEGGGVYGLETGVGCDESKSDGVSVNVFWGKIKMCTITIPSQFWLSNGESSAVFWNSTVWMTQETEGVDYIAEGFCENGEFGDGSIKFGSGGSGYLWLQGQS